jgi:hypothetical protein
MNPTEFRDAPDTLGLTRARAAEALHISLRTVYSHLSGETPIPALTAAVLRLMVDGRINPSELVDAA